MANLSFTPFHPLSAQASVSPSPPQAANAKEQVAYTTLISPFPVLLSACIHPESRNLCRCKVCEGTLSPCEGKEERKRELNTLEYL